MAELADIRAVTYSLHKAIGAAHAHHVETIGSAEEYLASARACGRSVCSAVNEALTAAERLFAELDSRPVYGPPKTRDGIPPAAIWGHTAIEVDPDQPTVEGHPHSGRGHDAAGSEPTPAHGLTEFTIGGRDTHYMCRCGDQFVGPVALNAFEEHLDAASAEAGIATEDTPTDADLNGHEPTPFADGAAS